MAAAATAEIARRNAAAPASPAAPPCVPVAATTKWPLYSPSAGETLQVLQWLQHSAGASAELFDAGAAREGGAEDIIAHNIRENSWHIAANLYRLAGSLSPGFMLESKVSVTFENMHHLYLNAWNRRDHGVSLRLCEGAAARLLARMLGSAGRTVELKNMRPVEVGRHGTKKELFLTDPAANTLMVARLVGVAAPYLRTPEHVPLLNPSVIRAITFLARKSTFSAVSEDRHTYRLNLCDPASGGDEIVLDPLSVYLFKLHGKPYPKPGASPKVWQEALWLSAIYLVRYLFGVGAERAFTYLAQPGLIAWVCLLKVRGVYFLIEKNGAAWDSSIMVRALGTGGTQKRCEWGEFIKGLGGEAFIEGQSQISIVGAAIQVIQPLPREVARGAEAVHLGTADKSSSGLRTLFTSASMPSFTVSGPAVVASSDEDEGQSEGEAEPSLSVRAAALAAAFGKK